MPLDMPVDFTDILAWAVKEMTIKWFQIDANIKKGRYSIDKRRVVIYDLIIKYS